MTMKIAIEHDNRTPRSYMQPMIGSCQLLCQLLVDLSHDEDPDVVQYLEPGRDQALIGQYEMEVEPRLRSWPLDEGTPNSTGGELKPRSASSSSFTLADLDSEAYEHSDYGTESDDALES